MATKYAIFNPITAQYNFASTIEDAITESAKIAAEFYLSHSHNQPIVKVQVDATGAETWSALSGEEVLSPAQMDAQVNELKKQMEEAFAGAHQMPVTNL